MFEAMCHFNLDAFTHFLSVDEIMGPYSRPHVSQSYVFECADGGWIALHMSSPPKFWENLATAMGVPDMLEREEFATRPARIRNYEKVLAFLAPIFKSQPRAHWEGKLTALEVPHSAILNSKEVLEGPLGQHHGILAEADSPRGKFRTIRSPLHFDGEIEREITAPPDLGQDNAEYLGAKP
jgi:crotonobetainyl-CoA:carnitine CoA-transferase CaiB-like acyl-CoA transferase